jgi:hypothetical protein
MQNLAAAEPGSPASRLLQIGVFASVIVKIVPTLCVGTQPRTLRVQQSATGNWQLATSGRQPTTQSVDQRIPTKSAGTIKQRSSNDQVELLTFRHGCGRSKNPPTSG